MLGDTAVAVHPDDPKWKHLIGKHAILPLVGRRIPIVADEYSDPGEGLGRGQDHAGARLQRFRGRQAAQARGRSHLRQVRAAERQRRRRTIAASTASRRARSIVADLEAAGLVEKIEPHTHAVPYGDRGGVPVEPFLTDNGTPTPRSSPSRPIAAAATGA